MRLPIGLRWTRRVDWLAAVCGAVVIGIVIVIAGLAAGVVI